MAIATHPSLTGRRPAFVAPRIQPRPRPAPHALIVHHADVVRAGISAVLTSGTDCEVTNAASIFEALRIAQARHPQVVLFDYPAREGAEACRLLAGLWPRPRLVALVGSPAEVDPTEALKAGADGVVALDSVSRETLVALVGRVLDGVRPLVAGFGQAPRAAERVDDDPTAVLTPREREMLYLIGEGLSNREIAEALVLSVKTVETHRANLARKLGIRSRAGLMRLAISANPVS
jgi:DNA-binding NarL/FixJ family response regulator